MLTNKDVEFLEMAVDLAEEALQKGDQPFGSVLVSENNEVLFKDHNRSIRNFASRSGRVKI